TVLVERPRGASVTSEIDTVRRHWAGGGEPARRFRNPGNGEVMQAGRRALFAGQGLLLIELPVTLVAAGMDVTPVDGVLDGAAVLVSVRAVGETAVGDEGPELDEIRLQLAGYDTPELELPETGCVDDETARLEFDELGGACGVLALEGP